MRDNVYKKSNATMLATLIPRMKASHMRQVIAIISLARPRHWAKNALVFAPLVAAHSFFDANLLMTSIVAFLAMCCQASAGYAVNDLIDLPHNHVDPRKVHRPLASGEMTIATARVLALVFLSVGFGLGAIIGAEFLSWLILYFVGSISYSVFFKRVRYLDVLVLSLLYCVRLLAGGAAVDVFPSNWLLGFSLFLFLGLACLKRYWELGWLSDNGFSRSRERGYGLEHRQALRRTGIFCGGLAVAILGAYSNSEMAGTLYGRPWVFFIICFLLILWLVNIWTSENARRTGGDPYLFAVSNRTSLMIGAMSLLAFGWAL